VLRGCLAKFFCKLGMWFFEDHPAKKKKRVLLVFFEDLTHGHDCDQGDKYVTLFQKCTVNAHDAFIT
jgi:hypothetical protein